MSGRDFITLQRRSLDSWLWDMPAEQTKVAMTLMLMANWKDGQTFSGGEVVRVHRGQVMTSLESLACRSRVTVRKVRTALKNLQKCEFLSVKTTSRFSIITIRNYDELQSVGASERHSTDTTPTRGRQADDTSPTCDRQAGDTPVTTIEPGNQETKEPGNQETSQSAPARDAVTTLADEIWQEHEALHLRLRADGISPNAHSPGLMSPLKLELVHRISETLSGGKTLDDAAKASRHALAVLEDEARRTGSLRWLDGGAWKMERYPHTLAREVGEQLRTPPAPTTSGEPSTINTEPVHRLETPLEALPSRQEGDSF